MAADVVITSFTTGRKDARVAAVEINDLDTARGSGNHADGTVADAERAGHRGQRRLACLLPSIARALTRTARAPSCSPPTPGRAEPGFTRMVVRTQPVSALIPARPSAERSGCVIQRQLSDREPPFCVGRNSLGMTANVTQKDLSVALECSYP